MFGEDNKNPGQWEVVGGKATAKTNKNNKSPSNKNGTAGKKSGPSPPILKVDELVSPLDTKYALLDPQLRAQAKREALGLPPVEKSKSKPAAQAKEAAAKKKPAPKESSGKENVKEKSAKTLPDALKKLNVEELTQAMAVVRARFAGSRLLWLKELTSHLNNKLNVETDPTFAGKPRDYPSTILPTELKQLILSTIKDCEDEAKQAFYTQSLITMPNEINRGVPVNGSKIVLQLLSFHEPTLALSFLPKASETLGPIESRVPATLSLLWVLSQSSFKDTRVGIQVWMEAMLPLINLKNYTAFVGLAAGHLTAKELKLQANTLSVPDYFRLKDQVSLLPSVARQNVSDLAQALTQPMMVHHGAKMFAQLLRRLESNRPDECRAMVECLNADPASYGVWRKDYKSNMMASSQLLKWINVKGRPKDRSSFHELLLHFRSINESFPPGKTPSEAQKSCTALCNTLIGQSIQKKKTSSKKLKYLNFLLFIGLVSLVYYDVRVHGQGRFEQGRLGGALQRYGVTEKAHQLRQRAEPYVEHVRINALHLRDVIYHKGEELYPGIWAAADLKYQAGLSVVKEKSAIVYEKASVYAEIGLERGAYYFERFADWSAVYRQQIYIYSEKYIQMAQVYGAQAKEVASVYLTKAIEITSVYYQRVTKFAVEVLNEDRVQNALKYTQDMYHKAMHAVGICTH